MMVTYTIAVRVCMCVYMYVCTCSNVLAGCRGLLVFQNLVLDGAGGLAGVGDPEPELLGDDCICTSASTKLEGDDVWVLLLGSDFEDVVKGTLVLDTPPSCSV